MHKMFGRRRLNKKNMERNRRFNRGRTNIKEKLRERKRKGSYVGDLVNMSIKEINEMGEVADSVGQFRHLLNDQLSRVLAMTDEKSRPKDYSSMTQIVIGLVPGDGIGPIIMEQAERLLKVLLEKELRSGTVVLKEIEGLTIENRLQKQETIPADVMAQIKKCDVLLKGPTTTPKGGNMESANVRLRKELDLYANVRPVYIPEKNIDWVFFRENTEGEYALGSSGVEIPGKLAIDFKVTTEPGTKRIARRAFDYADSTGRNRVSIVTKANIMKKTDGNFSRICHEVGGRYPNIEMDEWYIDIMAANLVNEDIRSDFQVFLLPNLYGDIITDLAAQLQGGVGTAGSANIGDQYAMFEAIHGSAPRMIEDGLGDYANPASIFKACEMMLTHIGFHAKARALESVLDECLNREKSVVVTGFKEGATCKEFADYVIGKLL
ncbi:isocitrate/isopropylmalate family dehydrogenase [Eubacterium sp. AB3007]|uniref:isocitrate/isopropylmalate family dehydrogenase n=1 Tax=Eubacterium sp. AB3007 TaxID=1392487 RepID=UPI003510A73C